MSNEVKFNIRLLVDDLPSDTLYEYGTSESDALFAAEDRPKYNQ